jgi:hypothetical protein
MGNLGARCVPEISCDELKVVESGESVLHGGMTSGRKQNLCSKYNANKISVNILCKLSLITVKKMKLWILRRPADV